MLFNSGQNLLRAEDSDGNTVLHTAARRGHPEMIRNLLWRCDPDMWCMCARSRWTRTWLEQGDANNETALHLAARHGHTRFVAGLLHAAGESAASLSLIGDRLNGTALHSAVSKRRHGVIQSILGHFVHSEKCMHRTVSQLLEHRNVNGHGALHLAVQGGDSRAVLLMLRARGLIDRQRYQSIAQNADLDQEYSNGASGLEADVHAALRWAALAQPQGWQTIIAAGIVPLLDLSDCESSVGHDHLQGQLIPDGDQPLSDDSRLGACLLRASMDYESSAASLLGMLDVKGGTRSDQQDFPSDLIVASMKSLATTTCFSAYLFRVSQLWHVCCCPARAARIRCVLQQF
eukprot:COSAG02_NODE_2751_length_8098_cov_4.799600_10_plen_346_part_00